MTTPQPVSDTFDGERGSVSLLLAVLAVALLAVAGLVVDGGGKVLALARADDGAAAAARCATQALDLEATRAGEPRVDPHTAAARARDCLHAAGLTGSVTITDTGRRLAVTAEQTYQPVFLGAVGMDPSTVTGQAIVTLAEVQQGAIR
jgi:Flp pilus assembly protein TadG